MIAIDQPIAPPKWPWLHGWYVPGFASARCSLFAEEANKGNNKEKKNTAMKKHPEKAHFLLCLQSGGATINL